MNSEELQALQVAVHNKAEALLKAKNADYADQDDPFFNLSMCEKLGICSTEVGILVRMCDKISRMAKLLKRPNKVVDEKIEDTALDLENYAFLFMAWGEEKRGRKLKSDSPPA